ncbi:MAG: MarR family transcriptional regulator [Chloroflexi bacterium]|nr:MarR family transcriptional regulator [Chloroflexota bacterium]MBV9896967.1 MarR family transcriptional regulator [Chloroflexota bacterium]
MTTTTSSTSVDAALQAFHQWMAALQVARARRGEPWSECPMTVPQLRALSSIIASPSGRTSRELATLLGVGASAITPLVDRLVDHGFVERHEDPRDRRIAHLTATPTGRETLERMLAGKGEVMREALSRLGTDELELVTLAFGVLRAAVQPLEGI